MNKSDLIIASFSDSDNTIINNQIYQIGEYNQEILIDKKKLKQIQHENFSLSNYSGFKTNSLQKLGIKPRNHHLFYGLNIQEKALEISYNV